MGWVLKCIGAVLAAIMFAAGVGPEDAASNLSKWLNVAGVETIPSWLTTKTADKSVLLIGSVFFIGWGFFKLWALAKRSRKPQVRTASEEFERTAKILYGQPWWKRKILNWWNSRNEPPWVMPPGYTSMRDAAHKYYNAAKAGKIPFDQHSNGSFEDILNYWAVHISKVMQIYGRWPPSSLLTEIPPGQMKHFIFVEEATKLKDVMRDSIYYTDIAVKTDVLEEQYGFESGFHEESS